MLCGGTSLAKQTRMSSSAKELLRRIESRQARVGVVGLGYVGLPLAVEFARNGFTVVGIDLDRRKVDAISAGHSYIPDVPTSDVEALVAAGRLRATNDFSCVAELDTINICVPTPLRKTKDPDMSFVVSAVEAIAEHVHPGMLVILESTTYPGTTEELLQPALERGGLRAGTDFFLAFSPERVDPGNERFNTRNVPKVVGGMTPQCCELARALYATSIQTVVPVSSPGVAEMVKLLENTFRAVNIGLVNEIALMCDRLGIDVWEVIQAAKTKPFGFMPFYPGPGLGGHCIPIDPFYLSWKAKQSGFEARFIELAGAVNTEMPRYVLSLVADALNAVQRPVNGSRVLVAGVAYKKDVDDIRESPALDLLGLLKERGAELDYTDPHVPHLPGKLWTAGTDLKAVDPAAVADGAYDCVVIVTEHAAFDYDRLQAIGKTVVDTRNAVKNPGPHVIRLGAPARPGRLNADQDLVAAAV
jgi:UDP-N-acetyl-D-glucosamine dehydrogenase